MNRVILKGTIVNDLDLIENNDKKYLQFSLAVKKPYKKDAVDFIRCVSFNKTADFIKSYFKKGSNILVEGNLSIGFYEKDGEKRESYSVIIENCFFCEKKSNSAENNADHSNVKDLLKNVDDEPLPF